MNYLELKKYINSDSIDKLLKKAACLSNLDKEKNRYHKLLEEAYNFFGDGDYHFVSSPGRTEIGGNHTDHQHGHVVAATLSIDNVCVFKKSEDSIVTFKDPLFNEVKIDLTDISVIPEEKNTSASLIRGIAARLKQLGYKIGGFRAICDSRVLVGASISSSACFEVMIVEIFNCLFNDGKIPALTRALVGQYAENIYFGKASGLLDQLTISVGGFVTADFKDPENPVIENFDFSFDECGYKFFIVNTRGTHSGLSDEYSLIPYEIKEVSKQLNVDYLAESSYEELINNFSSIREKVNNDRALLRSIHFFEEDKRAIDEKEAIRNKDINALFKLMIESGKSSFMYLQNVYAIDNVKSQGLSIALALTEHYLNGKGAFRMQGGGFEGTIIAVVQSEIAKGYIELMNSVFGDNSVLDVSIRPLGTITII